MLKNKFSQDDIKISVIGLGYVGLPLAIEFGKKFKTIGYDINENRIKDLLNFKDTTNEVTEQEFLESRSLSFSSAKDSIKGSDFYIITVPTPIDSSNNPDISYLISASKLVAENITKDNIVIYESTVYPGCTEEVCTNS